MSKIDYALGLSILVPKAQCTRQSTYEDITNHWRDERLLPTKEDIEDAYIQWKIQEDTKQTEKDAIKQKIKNGENVSLKDLTKIVADLI